ncbi:type II toxin-antitoxin system YoeB family toxin [Megasphaera stantonii]|jgi:toxin YoeB
MNKLWSDRAWDDYLYWQMQDKKTLKRINDLIKDIDKMAWHM